MRLFSTFLLGVTAGLRSMSGPAAAMKASRRVERSGAVPFLDKLNLPAVFAMLAIAEMLADKLPFMPNRKAPPAFAWRVVAGALSAAAVTAERDSLALSVLAGAAGAVTGTLGGSALRARLAQLFDHDFPAALVEDALVVTLSALAARGLEARPADSPVAA
jgi:uncharacterized membrane protein